MFKILIDATCIFDQPSGIGYYTLNLIHYLSDFKQKYNFELELMYKPRLKNIIKGKFDLPSQLSQYESNLLKIQIPSKVFNFLYDYFPYQISKYIENKPYQADVIHNPNYYILPFQNSKTVITIHDLTFLKYPSYIDNVVKRHYERIVKCLPWVDLILTVSHSSKQDIVDFLGVKPSKIRVTPLASRFNNIDLKKQNDGYANNKKPFLLFIGNIEPRKNIIGLIKAFNYLKGNYKIEHELVIIGQKGWKYNQIFKAINSSPYRNQIHNLNYISDQELLQFYLEATMLVYPSFYEGFGLPVIEAMTLGTPVITSNNSSLKEIARDATLLVDPNNYQEIAHSILAVINSNQLQQELISKGKRRAKEFSWEKTAEQTIEAYLSII